MNRLRAIKLFDTDCCPSVFNAEIGTGAARKWAVHVYPRKSQPGFIWIVRKGRMGLDNSRTIAAGLEVGSGGPGNLHDGCAVYRSGRWQVKAGHRSRLEVDRGLEAPTPFDTSILVWPSGWSR